MTRVLIRRPLLLAIASLCAVLGLATTGRAAAVPPTDAAPRPAVIYDCSGNAQVKPRSIDSIFCGDAGIIITGLSWRTWHNTSAIGQGIEHRKTCRPDCASGPVAVDKVTVRLFAPKAGGFTKITVTPVRGKAATYQLTGSRTHRP